MFNFIKILYTLLINVLADIIADKFVALKRKKK